MVSLADLLAVPRSPSCLPRGWRTVRGHGGGARVAWLGLPRARGDQRDPAPMLLCGGGLVGPKAPDTATMVVLPRDARPTGSAGLGRAAPRSRASGASVHVPARRARPGTRRRRSTPRTPRTPCRPERRGRPASTPLPPCVRPRCPLRRSPGSALYLPPVAPARMSPSNSLPPGTRRTGDGRPPPTPTPQRDRHLLLREPWPRPRWWRYLS